MTIEELKEEAKKLGYTVVKIPKKEKLLPCVCGNNRREHWHRVDIKSGRAYEILRCSKCGREAKGETERDAIHNWNEMIKKEESKCQESK